MFGSQPTSDIRREAKAGPPRLQCGMVINPHDYCIFTSRRGEHPGRWCWEIRRKSQSLGSNMVEDGYQSVQPRSLLEHWLISSSI
jgi:hypothetical protein